MLLLIELLTLSVFLFAGALRRKDLLSIVVVYFLDLLCRFNNYFRIETVSVLKFSFRDLRLPAVSRES